MSSAHKTRSPLGAVLAGAAGVVLLGVSYTAVADAPGWPAADAVLPVAYRVLAGVSALCAVWMSGSWLRWRYTPVGKLARLRAQAARNGGFATRLQVYRHAGWWWIHRHKARALRPSFGFWRRWTAPMREYAVRLVKAGWLLSVYASLEQVTIRISPPRGGKTGELCCHVVDAPGAVVVTSTKVDVVVKTIDSRRLAGPVAIFNPEGMGGSRYTGTFCWNPLTGCDDPMIAHRRAVSMMGGAPASESIGETGFWTSQGVRALSQFLHAAALDHRSMLDVLAWVSDPARHVETVRGLLARSRGGEAWMHDFGHFAERTSGRTQSSITTTVMPALEWLKDPALQAVVLPSPGGDFNVEAFLELRGTLYLLSDGDGVSVAPLFAALVDFLWYEAKKIASRTGEEGRLDPPCTFVLDECANICPVPLQRWTSDGGGRGMPLHLAFQSRSQLYVKWGQDGGRTIWGNAGAVLIYGNILDENDLEAFSRLCGERDEPVESTSDDGRVTTSVRSVRIMPPEDIRLLPEFSALVLRGSLPAVVGQVPMIWGRKDARRDRKRAELAARRAQAAAAPRERSISRRIGSDAA
ncbi:type IV secretory system conjugative DNA transfer family protein [Longispora albida]|uniref:type IV secretory system conjugative DNA transfer family protein n=1 Tax=Longispora albida TaxID=203523 RepID=UPI00036998C5|nr:type IV secretory system conjugative DNA transfer family protein [Longispora albida]